jgi:polyhydroxyalkanoate synthesis regulator phasin
LDGSRRAGFLTTEDEEGTMSEDEKKSAREKVSDGIRQGIGVLSAFRDALEETINEARERGDLSSDRAKQVMKNALHRAQEAAEGAKERLDFVSQKEFDALVEAVERIKERLDALEGRSGMSGHSDAAGNPEAGDGGTSDQD